PLPHSSTPFPSTTLFRSSCTHCETENLDRFEDLNDRTWTCKTCGEPVLVELENSDGDKHYVQAQPVPVRHRFCRSRYDHSGPQRSEEHTSELQSRENIVC